MENNAKIFCITAIVDGVEKNVFVKINLDGSIVNALGKRISLGNEKFVTITQDKEGNVVDYITGDKIKPVNKDAVMYYDGTPLFEGEVSEIYLLSYSPAFPKKSEIFVGYNKDGKPMPPLCTGPSIFNDYNESISK